MEQNTKICPYCGATINAIARKCRFCGEWQSDEDRIAHGQAVASYRPVQPTNIAPQDEVLPVKEEVKEETHSDDVIQSESVQEPVSSKASPVVPPTEPLVNAEPPVYQEDDDKTKKIIYGIIGVVVVVFVAFLIFRGQNNSGNNNYNTNDDPSYEIQDTVPAYEEAVPDVEDGESSNESKQGNSYDQKESNSSGLTLPDEDYDLPQDDGLDKDGTDGTDEFTIN